MGACKPTQKGIVSTFVPVRLERLESAIFAQQENSQKPHKCVFCDCWPGIAGAAAPV
jgi:hypothetical protein